MMIRNTGTAWGVPARLLHWAMAGVILFMLGLGFYTANLVTDTYEQFGLVQIHKSWGFVAFALAVLRVIWRLANPTPALPAGMPKHEKALAHGGHLALYVLMFLLPISGWLMASASPLQELYNIKNMVFGLFELPDPFPTGDEGLQQTLRAVHFYAALGIVAILIGHAGAALKHHFVNRDTVLKRMTVGAP